MSLFRLTADKKVTVAEHILGHTFANKRLCLTALQMSGSGGVEYAGTWYTGIAKNNTLAEHGDKVLDFVLNTVWIDRLYWVRTQNVNWDAVKKTLLTNKQLHKRGVHFGLHQCVLVDSGTLEVSPKMMATTFEALIGAVNRDAGLAAVKRVVEGLGFLDHEVWGWPGERLVR